MSAAAVTLDLRRDVGSLGERSADRCTDPASEAEPVTTNGDATVIINDRYEMHKRIGRGGMADVFLARDRLLDRQVAIKVLFPEFAIDPNFVERFRREAQAAANLSHPNIVNVYDWGKYAGTYFIAMEYVAGPHAGRDPAHQRPLTAKQAAEIASEVAAALGFAHEAGLVHRDIKPANILIGTNGQVKVADFGIARAMNAADRVEPHPGRRGDGHGDVLLARAGPGRPARPAQRPLLARHRDVRDGRRPAAVHRREPGEHRLQAGPRPARSRSTRSSPTSPGRSRRSSPSCSPRIPKLRYPSANALRDDLRRFRNGEQVQALVSAVAGSQARTAVARRHARRRPRSRRHRHRRAPSARRGMPMAAAAMAATTAQSSMAGYPPGASPAARYYEDRHSRTGWYALAAFFALIALGVGGVLLFHALTKDDSETVGIDARRLRQPAARRRHRRARALGLDVPSRSPRRTRPSPRTSCTAPTPRPARSSPRAP